MKVLKSLAVLTAVLAFGACETAPGNGGGGSGSLDAALGDAIGGVGSTAGLTRYNYQGKNVQGESTFTLSYAFFINPDTPTEIKQARAVLVDGTMQGSDGKDYPVSAQLQTQNSYVYGSPSLPKLRLWALQRTDINFINLPQPCPRGATTTPLQKNL